MPTASSVDDYRGLGRPPRLSKSRLLLGAITVLTPFSLDLYLPALPAIAADLQAPAGAVHDPAGVFRGSRRQPVVFRLGDRPPGSASAAALRLALLAAESVGCAPGLASRFTAC
jgi:DHA1 family bicyclomycin/chloramphenicol resistance-like MFS transporter